MPTEEKSKPRDITDADIEALINDTTLTENIKKAEAKVRGISRQEKHRLRALCKRDLFFLCSTILGYNRLSVNLHGHLCTHIKKTENERFREFLLARGNFKSTIITIGHSIQIVLPYDAEDKAEDEEDGELPWPMNLGTDCRLLIAHETHESAARFLYAITSHFTTNPLLMGLFPEAVPSVRKNRINKWELELPRSTAGNPEPTIDTLGVGGKSQGRHYNYIKLDDIYGDKARDSAAESATTKEWFDNIQAFFSHFSKDHMDLIGTRYSYDDIYAHAEERYGKQLIVYRRKIEEQDPRYPHDKSKTIITFPEEFTVESLAILKQNKKIYTAQYLNDPDVDGAGFDQEHIHYFYWTSLTTLVIFEGEERHRTEIHIRDLDICILIDPGVNKSGGFTVTGMDNHGRVFVLVAIRLDLKPPDFVELTFSQVMRWQPRVVAIESDVFANTYQYWFASEMGKRGIRFKIEPVMTRQRSKDLRISGLSNYMAAGQFYVNEKQEDLNRELKTWGKSKNIHILDALAYGPEVWRPGMAPGTRMLSLVRDEETRDSQMDIETGYSAQ